MNTKYIIVNSLKLKNLYEACKNNKELTKYFQDLFTDCSEVVKTKSIKSTLTDIVSSQTIAKNTMTCPDCKGHLVITDPNLLLLSMPPQQKVHCNKCSYEGFIQV